MKARDKPVRPEKMENDLMQRRTYGALAALALAGAALGTAALADRPGAGRWGGGPDGRPFPPFDLGAVDADGDGRVTPAELAAWRAGRVTAMDANGDGLLSVDEIKAMHMARAEARADAMAARMMSERDANGDGLLNAAEMQTPPVPERLFERVDANGDGAITQDEIDAATARMADRGRHRDAPDADE